MSYRAVERWKARGLGLPSDKEIARLVKVNWLTVAPMFASKFRINFVE